MRENLNIRNGVLIGAHDELYLAQGNHSPVDYFLGNVTVARDSIDSFWDNFDFRSKFCSDLGAIFSHVVFPDKHVIESDNFPLGRVSGLFECYKEKRRSSKVIYPASSLRESDERVFHRDDTHMNIQGVKIVLLEIVRSILPDLTEKEVWNCLNPVVKLKSCVGDLSSKIGAGSREIEVFTPPKGTRVLSNGVKGGIMELLIFI
ncbi:hypothetical protein QT397_07825 [Microbulbifer sp. MKSA007]|nr:hypothetical protein QT397_07825 [Microbulbifer sp. MKSA007]